MTRESTMMSGKQALMASVKRQRSSGTGLDWRKLTVQLVDRPIGRGLIGAVDEGVAAALHQDRGACQAVLLEELPESALVAI